MYATGETVGLPEWIIKINKDFYFFLVYTEISEKSEVEHKQFNWKRFH